MKISGEPPFLPVSKVSSSTSAPAARPAPEDSATDTSSISDLSARIQSAAEERVAALKKAYERGDYAVSSEAVAARVIDDSKSG